MAAEIPAPAHRSREICPSANANLRGFGLTSHYRERCTVDPQLWNDHAVTVTSIQPGPLVLATQVTTDDRAARARFAERTADTARAQRHHTVRVQTDAGPSRAPFSSSVNAVRPLTPRVMSELKSPRCRLIVAALLVTTAAAAVRGQSGSRGLHVPQVDAT